MANFKKLLGALGEELDQIRDRLTALESGDSTGNSDGERGVRVIHDADIIESAFDDLKREYGRGRVRLPPGEYDLSETQELPKAGGPWELDASQATIRGSFDGDYLAMESAPKTGSPRFDMDIGEINATKASDPGIGLRLTEIGSSFVRANVVGEFDIGIKQISEKSSGHMTNHFFRTKNCDIGLQIGEDGSGQTLDRCHYQAQLINIGDVGMHVENARNNDFFTQPENERSDAEGETIGVKETPTAGNNKYRMSHSRCATPYDIQAPRSTLDHVGFGGRGSIIHRSRIGIPPRHISMPNVRTEQLNFGGAVLASNMYDSSNARIRKWSDLFIDAGDTAGNTGHFQLPNRPGQRDIGWIGYTMGGLEHATGMRLRFGFYVDEDNYAMLVADPENEANVQAEVAVDGIVEYNTVSSHSVDDDDHAWQVQFREDSQRFFYDCELIGETEVDTSSWSAPETLRIDVLSRGGSAIGLHRGIEYAWGGVGRN